MAQASSIGAVMTAFKSDFLQIMSERGFLHQCSDPQALDSAMLAGPVTGYIGFDCTAPSLHVGSLLQIMMLRWMQKTGHRPIALMGGGTTRVGDPTGKDESRKILSDVEIETNKNGIRAAFSRFIDFGNGPTDALMIDNAEWLLGLN
jgi:tyrosyl-tRNA synthetase